MVMVLGMLFAGLVVSISIFYCHAVLRHGLGGIVHWTLEGSYGDSGDGSFWHRFS